MNYAVILASGQGKRLNSSTPKQFLLVNNHPLIFYTISAFEKCPDIDEIIIVSKKKYFPIIYQIIDKYGFNKVHMLVQGGKTRQLSSYNALVSLKNFALKKDVVVIHDAARPLISSEQISLIINETIKHNAVILVSNVTNTIVDFHNHKYQGILNRHDLLNAETPQSFTYGLILKAHENAKIQGINNATDDAQLVNNINKKIYVIKNQSNNLKVTTSSDIEILQFLLNKEVS